MITFDAVVYYWYVGLAFYLTAFGATMRWKGFGPRLLACFSIGVFWPIFTLMCLLTGFTEVADASEKKAQEANDSEEEEEEDD